LPAALLVVAWWRRGRLSWRNDVIPLLPWLVLGVAAGLFTSWFERTGIGAQGADFDLSIVERVLVAGRAFWFYLGKLIWPADLTFFYPRWNVDGSVAWQYLFPAAALALVSGLAWLAWRKGRRGPLAAFLIFGGTLFPVLGFVNVYPFVFSYVADHFQYQASLAMIALAAATATHAFAHLRWPRWSGPAAAAAVLLLLGVLTSRQSVPYRDIFSLYETTLARNPSSWAAHLNLGAALVDVGRPQESLPHQQHALELRPDTPEVLNSLGNALNLLGRSPEARPFLEKAIRLQPRFAEAHNTLGVSLMALGEP
jgi:tetratricopeptide (TPR) repeat protein